VSRHHFSNAHVNRPPFKKFGKMWKMCKQHTIKLSRRISIETQSLWGKN
jgi:hypothetical protein